MEKVFLAVLHEEEQLSEATLDMLRGGVGSGDCSTQSGYCPCNNAECLNNIYCPMLRS